MRRIIPLILALVLAACATIPNPVTHERVRAIKESYGIALAAATAYRDSCDQRLIPSSCRAVVPRLVRADEKVRLVVAKLSRLEKLGPNIDLTDAVNELSDAVNDFKIVNMQFGVK